MLFLVRLAFSAAPCNALSAERRDALHTNRHTRAGQGSIGDLRTARTLNRSRYPIATICVYFFPSIFLNICSLRAQHLFVAFCSAIFWFWFFYKGAKKKIFSDTTEKSRDQDWCFCPVTCRSVGLLLQAFVHWVILTQVYVNVTLKEEYRGSVRVKTSWNPFITPSWAVPSCGTRLQPWSWCCSPKVSSHQLLWQCACRRSTRASLPLIFWTRSWRWILMMTCRVLPARESRARAKPLRSSFPNFVRART